MDKFYTAEVTTQGYYNPQEYADSELRGRCGIYQIRNAVNGKVYVGSSVNLINRRAEHFRQLRKNIHHNIKLQYSYNKHGEPSFVFEVVEFVDKPEDLISREQYWIDKLEAVNKGYNIYPTANSPLGTRHTPEFIERLRVLNTGKLNPMYGKHHSEESRRKMSLNKIGTQTYGKNPRAKAVICLTDGETFDCVQRCAEYYHKEHSGVRKNIRYKYKNPPIRFMFLDKYNELIEQGLKHEDIVEFHKQHCKP